ncbi:beta strand repeat-containing protein [Polaribacter sp. HL-MS24]|uniref:beta strand repeat-containing protein n=1 Tax=Polaribacter sp. HL-MS24 TaxID=3077735 RepID=UPI00293459EE|nr:Ig-like domain-containing protein [Polaribacter sp. HL-MS24]WOC39442.1 Ig-like domain-containing protein [Polaribacter sp. HL-MS24]
MSDDFGDELGAVADGETTDDLTPTIFGEVAAALPSGAILQIYDGDSPIGEATFAPNSLLWSFTPSQALAERQYNLKANIEENSTILASSNSFGFITALPSLPTTIATIATVTDDAGDTTGTLSSGASTDDRTPAMAGTLSTTLGADEVLALYEGSTRLGEAVVDTITKTSWSFDLINNAPFGLTAGVTVDATTNTITKTAANDWNAMAISTQQLSGDASVSITVDVNNTYKQIGFATSSNPAFNGEHTLRYAMYMYRTGKIYINELESRRANEVTTYAANDVLTVRRTGSKVTYLKNGTVFYESRYASTGNVYAGGVIYTSGAILQNMEIVTELSFDSNTLTVQVEDTATGLSGPASDPFVLNVNEVVLSTISDNFGPEVGAVLQGESTDDLTPTLVGTLGAPLGAGEKIQVYNGTTSLGTATLDGLNWNFTPSQELAIGDQQLSAKIENASGDALMVSETVGFTTVLLPTPPTTTAIITTVTDDVGDTTGTLSSGASTDDRTPAMAGTLSTTLGADEVLALYEGSTRLGEAVVDTITKTSWSFDLINNAPFGLTAGVTVDATTNTITKTAVNDWNAMAISTQQLSGDASVSITVDVNNTYKQIGFATSSNPAFNGEHTLRYAMYMYRTGKIYINELGSRRASEVTTYAANDVLTVRRTGSKVTYLKNGTVFYESRYASTGNVYAGGVIYTSGAILQNMKIATELSFDSNTLTVQVEDTATGLSGPASDPFVLNVNKVVLTGLSDDFGSVVGPVLSGEVTDDLTPTLSGTLGVPLGAGEYIQVYNGTTSLGTATLDGLNWNFTPSQELAIGDQQLSAKIENASGDALVVSETFGFTTVLLTPPTTTAIITTVTDDVGDTTGTLSSGATTDDRTPAMAGTLSTTLGADEVLALYEGSTRLGEAVVDTITKTSWSFDLINNAPFGLTAGVTVDATTNTITKTAANDWNAMAISTQQLSGDASVSITVDVNNTYKQIGFATSSNPAFNGEHTLRYAMYMYRTGKIYINELGSRRASEVTTYAANDVLTVRRTGSKVTYLKNGTVFYESRYASTGNVYAGGVIYTSGAILQNMEIVTELSFDSNTLTVQVEDTATGLSGPASDPFVLNVNKVVLTGLSDDFGSVVGPVLSGEATDDLTPTLVGTLGVPLGAGEKIQVYNGTTSLGTATLDGLNWNFTPSQELAIGDQQLSAKIENASGDALMVSETVGFTTVLPTPSATTAIITTVTDDVGDTTGTLSSGATTDDRTPAITGTLTAALGDDEVLALYEGSTRLGEAVVDTITKTSWSFDLINNAPFGLTAGVTVDATTNTITKTAANDWNAMAISTQQLSGDASVSITVDVNNTYKQIGFATSSNPAFNGEHTLRYAMYMYRTGKIYINELESRRANEVTTYAANDVLTVRRTGSKVTYLKNGTVFYESRYASTGNVYAGGVIYTSGAILQNMEIVTELSFDSNTLTVQVEDTATGLSGPASDPFVLNVNEVVLSTISDNFGPEVGAVLQGESTDDLTPTLVGTLGAPLGAGEKIQVYNGTTSLGTATLDGLNWNFTPSQELAIGDQQLSAKIENASGDALMVSETVGFTTVLLPTPPTTTAIITTVTDDVGDTTGTLSSGASTDDRTPAMAGTLSTTLGADEVLALYEGSTRLGEAVVDTITKTSWSFDLINNAPFGLTAGVTVDATTNTITKTAANDWNAMAISTQQLSGDASVSITVDVNNTYKQIGFATSSNPAFNGEHTLRYAMYMYRTGKIYINELESRRANEVTTYAANDVLTVRRTGSKVTYLKNGTVFYESRYASTGNVYAGGVIYTSGAILQNMEIVTELSFDSNTLTVQVEDTATGLSGPASDPFVLNVNEVVLSTISDNFGPEVGAVLQGESTDDLTPTLSGTLGAPLAANETLEIYNGTTLLGTATVNGLGWSFIPSPELSLGAQQISTSIVARGNALVTSTNTYNFTTIEPATAPSQTAVIVQVADNVGENTTAISKGASTDDATPKLSGMLSGLLVDGQVLAIYDLANGAKTKLGEATVSGTVWTYDASLAFGLHQLTAQVELSGTNLVGPSSEAFGVIVNGIQISSIFDDENTAGNVSNAGETDDPTPTLSGTLKAPLGTSETVKIYNGTALLGEAQVTGNQWTYTPTDALSFANYNFVAKIHNANGDVQLSSAAYAVQIIDATTPPPTQTVALLSVTDNVGLNGSVQGTLTSNSSTDDTTLALMGTLSAVLRSGQILAVYDQVNGITTKIGKATVNANTWRFTTPALVEGQHRLTLAVENTINGVQGPVSTAFTLQVQSITLSAIVDDQGTITGNLLAQGVNTTDDVLPVISGILTVPLGTGEEIGIYNGSNLLGIATTTGTDWTFTPSSDLSTGTHSLKAVIQATGTTDSTSGRVISGTQTFTILDAAVPVQTVTLVSLTDNAATNGSIEGTVASGSSTDDTTLAILGTLSIPLGTGQVLAVYDTFNGATAKIGNATLSTTTWTFNTPTLNPGLHSFTARVENTANNTQGSLSTPPYEVRVQSLSIAAVSDNIGKDTGNLLSQGVTVTDDSTPTLSGTVATALASTEQLSIYDTTGYLGAATVTGTYWTFTPSGNLSEGDHTFRAVIQATGMSTIATAQVVSNSVDIIVGNPAAPTQTVAILNVTDNVGVNGSVQGTLTSGSSSDDATLDLTGTLSTVLATGQILAVYDEVIGVNTKIGEATVNFTTWSFTTPALLEGQHRLTLVVENTINGSQGPVSAAFALQVQSIKLSAIMDDQGVLIGNLLAQGVDTTDDVRPVISGTLSTALGAGEEIAIYNGSNLLGLATTTGTDWTFTPSSDLPLGTHSLYVVVQATGTTDIGSGRVIILKIITIMDTAAPDQTVTLVSMTDNAVTNGSTQGALTSGSSTDDSTLDIVGTLSIPLISGQVLAIYDVFNGVTTKIGNATVLGTTWNFTTPTLGQGLHSLTAVVENTSNNTQGSPSSPPFEVRVQVLSIVKIVDDQGTITGNLRLMGASETDDGRPTLSGVISTDPGSGEELAVYDGSTYLGSATFMGTSWTFTPSFDIPIGEHSFRATIQATNNRDLSAARVISNFYLLTNVYGGIPSQTVTISSATDNQTSLGSVQGIVASDSSTDDNSLDLEGILNSALQTGQVLAIYDTSNGVSSRIGEANVSTTTWMFTANLGNGSHTLTARVENTTAGVYGAFSDGYQIHIQAPSLNTVTDDVGSIQGDVSTSQATDDTTPTLVGILGSTLGTNEVAAVYATVNGVVSRLGEATVNNDSSYSFTPASALSDGEYQFSVRVEDGTGSILAASSSRLLIINTSDVTQTITITEVLDDNTITGSVTGLVASGTTTDDSTPILKGTLSAPLTSGQKILVYVGSYFLGEATVSTISPVSWEKEMPREIVILDGDSDFTAVIENPSGSSTTSEVYTVHLQNILSFDIDGNSNSDLSVTTSPSPTLSGTLTASLGTNEELAMYSDENKIGTATVETDLSWTFTPTTPLVEGLHRVLIQVQDVTTGSFSTGRVVSRTHSFLVSGSPTQTVVIDGMTDDESVNGSSTGIFGSTGVTDDTTPSFSGTLNAPLILGQQVNIYEGTTLVGSAVTSGQSWSFSVPSEAALTTGTHSFTARVVNPGSGAQGPESSAFSFEVQQIDITTLTDNEGAVTGNLLADASSTTSFATDDTTPVIAGTTALALKAGHVVAIYNDGVRLGEATISNSVDWTFDIPTLNEGSHDLVAKIEDTTTGNVIAATTSSSSVTLHVDAATPTQTVAINTVVDDLYEFTFTGNLTDGSTTNDNVLDLSGTLSEPLTGPQVLAVYDGTTRMGEANPTGTAWTFKFFDPIWRSAAEQAGFVPITPDTISNISTTGNNFTKTGTADAWDAGFFASNVITGDGAVATTVVETNTSRIIGLSDLSSRDDNSLAAIKFAVLLKSNTRLEVYKEGAWANPNVTYATGDVVSIVRRGDQISVLKNGVEVHNFGNFTGDLYVDATFLTPNATLNNVVVNTTSASIDPTIFRLGSRSSLTAQVENPATGTNGPVSTPFTVVLQSVHWSSITDDVGTVTGDFLDNGATDDRRPTLAGTIGIALGANEVLGVYDGTQRIGQATVNGLDWSFTPTVDLTNRVHLLRVQVEDAISGSATSGIASSKQHAISVDATAPSSILASITRLTDNFGTETGVVVPDGITDDETPTVTGIVNLSLTPNQRVIIYDGTTLLGTATVTGTNWSFTTPTLAAGSHALTAVVENPALGDSGVASAVFNFSIQQITVLAIMDDVGVLQGNVFNGNNTQTNDTSLTYTGSLAGSLNEGQSVKVYDSGVFIGTATISGTEWSFVSPRASYGTHNLKFQIEDDAALGTGILDTRVTVEVVLEDPAFDSFSTSTYEIGRNGRSLDLTLVSNLDQPVYAVFNLSNNIGVTSGAGTNSLTLNIDDVMLSDVNLFNSTNGYDGLDATGRRQIRIDGTSGTVNVLGGGWTAAGTTTDSEGTTYNVFNYGTTGSVLGQLLIQDTVSHTGL